MMSVKHPAATPDSAATDESISECCSNRQVGWSSLTLALLCLIFGVPSLTVGILLKNTANYWHTGAVLAAPLLYAVLFALTAGVLSLPFHKCIVKGKFPRDVRHPVYRGRRLYGTCWTALYYFKPVYYLVLTLPCLKWMTFRLFGYEGQMDFTVYPDTWIRDLPLLDFGKGVYVANRATLGTNMPLKNGMILVDGIQIGPGTLIGHLTLIGAGVSIEENVEIESGCAIGIQVKIGANARIGAACGLNHFCNIGEQSVVGAGTRVGLRARVHAGERVEEISNIRRNPRPEDKKCPIKTE